MSAQMFYMARLIVKNFKGRLVFFRLYFGKFAKAPEKWYYCKKKHTQGPL